MKVRITTLRSLAAVVLTAASLLPLAKQPLAACDVCGCGVGGPGTGLSPFMDRSFLGLRMRSSSTRSHLTYGERFRTTEQFMRAELVGRIALSSDLQLQATLPWMNNQQAYLLSGDDYRKQGMGDVLALLAYAFVNEPVDTLGGSMQVQAGISVPTGSYIYDANAQDDVANANFQTGTGSVDILVGLNGTLRTHEYGVRGSTILRLPTTNPDNYRFGRSLSSTASAFMNIALGETLNVLPSLGTTIDVFGKNWRSGEYVSVTGGYVTWASAAATVSWKTLLLDMQMDVPVSQYQGEGALETNIRWSVSVGILM